MHLNCRTFFFRTLFYFALLSGGFASVTGAMPDSASHGMVTSSSQYASDIGTEVLKSGGNAVDAAVAVSYVLAVTHPAAGNIGGGGFMVIRLADGTVTTIDYREEAPGSATKTMYQDDNGNVITQLSRVGAKASGVPGTVAGMSYVLEKYGTKSLKTLIEPAIYLAREGFAVDEDLANTLNRHRSYLQRDPVAASQYTKREIFSAGDTLKLPQLATTLERIAEKGKHAFYQGVIAEQIVRTMQNLDGLITREDLRSFKVKERQPIHGTYQGYEIYSMPPPSSGGIALAGILGILEPYPLDKWGHNSAKTLHFKTEAERHIYADRNYFLGDPEFVDMPIQTLTSEPYYSYLRQLISHKATPSEQVSHISWDTADSLGYVAEHLETTHFSVIDADGNAVANTTTLNGAFGAGYAVEGAGFMMNNEMDDFSAKPGVPNMYGLIGAEANAIEPRKRMLSSMSPTIVTRDRKPVIITGTPGGSTIITTTAQIIMNVIDHGMSIREAVDAKRVHSQWLPDFIYYEEGALTQIDKLLLMQVGHTLKPRQSIGEANSVGIDPATGTIYSGADTSRGGTAAGY
ncbi:MAG: gamma-glutamyltransferase [Candidatus Marinimicrobia bacterium]|nr:gamma-glutamyltransferase [Candidatus Neomarinimicrobiota bacterium]MCF7828188.1 gamma-glutamyltransferase [Candidatus Neomarinimicrobiota bacterium]MCF7879637.1 gamma-glutamyltransferase [Candidatus Neomarinimicrobiota bacterium]